MWGTSEQCVQSNGLVAYVQILCDSEYELFTSNILLESHQTDCIRQRPSRTPLLALIIASGQTVGKNLGEQNKT